MLLSFYFELFIYRIFFSYAHVISEMFLRVIGYHKNINLPTKTSEVNVNCSKMFFSEELNDIVKAISK